MQTTTTSLHQAFHVDSLHHVQGFDLNSLRQGRKQEQSKVNTSSQKLRFFKFIFNCATGGKKGSRNTEFEVNTSSRKLGFFLLNCVTINEEENITDIIIIVEVCFRFRLPD